jgi:S-formylglutathione hydrolase FrmB
MLNRPLLISAALVLATAGAAASAHAQGTLERIEVRGASLEGNLSGDTATRSVAVYLPPSYRADTSRRYPVVYFLHGYGATAEAYIRLAGMPEALDKAIAGGAKEMIVVLPDAFTRYNGSMYSNSPTTGNWEGFIASDLVSYIDSHYRTVATRESRGLSGHSMGGYGTLRIGMKHPEVFSALYAMSSCCLMNNPGAARGRGPAPGAAPQEGARGRGGRGGRGGGFGNAQSAQAAAWSPNPQNPPEYFDPPVVDGVVQPLVAARFLANSPIVMVDQYVPSLKRYKAIALDVGNADGLAAQNRDLDAALTRLGVPHTFQVYEGDHGNRVAARFSAEVMSFFGTALAFPR